MARIFISHSSRDEDQAARLLNWLREAGFVDAFLDFDKHEGLAPGTDWERTLYREIADAEAVILVLTKNWFDSKWCFAEFTQARALGKTIFPLIEEPVSGVMVATDIQHLDISTDREDKLRRLRLELTRITQDAQGGFPWNRHRPPFPGLLAFDEADAAIYFGRDDDVRRLIERLNARRTQGGAKLLALLGASGAGKSSLMRAGLLPRLRRDERNWILIPPFRPRSDPTAELAQALATALGSQSDWRRWRDALVAGDHLPDHLHDLGRDLRMTFGANEAQILISIDQGEELFSTTEKGKANQFLHVLNSLLDESLPFMVVLALRADYLAQLQQAPGLQASFEEFSLKLMPLDHVRDIIEGPARVAALSVEPAFVTAAIRDASTDDALPLLAFALRELYDRHAGDHSLTLKDYRAFGDEKEGLSPLENAVRRRADQVLKEAQPTPEDLQALKEAFVPAMVRVNSEGEYVRRPAALKELPLKAQPLMERLAKARLLVIRPEGGIAIVEVAHEALLRKWPQLRSWLDEEREFLIGKAQLEQDLTDWEQAAEKEKAEALLSGLKLSRARAWLITKPRQLSELERKFIGASIAHQDATTARREKLKRYAQIASAAAALVLAFVASFAFWQRNVAENALERSARNYALAVNSAAQTVTVVESMADSPDITKQAAEKIFNVSRDTFSKILSDKENNDEGIRAQLKLFEVLSKSYHNLGNLQAAEAISNDGIKLALGAVERAPGNSHWQFALASAYRRLADVLQERGDLAGALETRRKWNGILAKLSKESPDNDRVRGDLAFSLEKIGDTLRRQGKVDETLVVYRQALEILTALRNKSPSNTEWQQELAYCHERMSDVYRALGDFKSSLPESQAYWDGFFKLHESDKSNTYWQRGLGLASQRYGDSLFGLGDLEAALAKYKEYNRLSGELARKDPSNTEWQRDWAVSSAKLGEIALKQGNSKLALDHYKRFLSIVEPLVNRDDLNKTWKHDRATAHALIGDALLADGRIPEAIGAYQTFSDLIAQLRERDATNAVWQRSLGMSHQRMGDGLLMQGELVLALEAYHRCLSTDIIDTLANVTLNRPPKLHEHCRRQIEVIELRRASNR